MRRRNAVAAALAAALAIEFVDELIGGTQGAALPLVRGSLHLTYGQIGLLFAAPLLIGSLLELPVGLVAGHGRRRHLLVLLGGLLVAAALVAVAAAPSFLVLTAAFVAFFPGSGAFVSLTQAALMDSAADGRQRAMAWWNLAGSAGAVGGPLLLAAVLAGGGTWRSGYLVLAALTGVALAGAAVAGPARRASAGRAPAGGAAAGGGGDQGPGRGGAVAADAGQAGDAGASRRISVRAALAALGDGQTARWLALLQISDLLLDVLTGFVGVYLVDVAKASPALAALGVAVRLGAGLAGDAIFAAVAARVSGAAALRGSAIAASLLYPAFLLAPGLPAKLVVLALLSMATACWYPVLQAGLYDGLPGRSGVAVFLSSAAGLVGAVGPLAVGLAAEHFGLTTALAFLAVAPAAIAAWPEKDRGAGRMVAR